MRAAIEIFFGTQRRYLAYLAVAVPYLGSTTFSDTFLMSPNTSFPKAIGALKAEYTVLIPGAEVRAV